MVETSLCVKQDTRNKDFDIEEIERIDFLTPKPTLC